MKKLLWTLPLVILSGCAGLQPYGGKNSVALDLKGEGESAVVTLDRLPEGLLVTFDVVDNELVARPEEKIWMSDGVEFYADLRPYRERVLLNGYARGVFQIIAVPPVDGLPVRWEILSRGFPVPEGFSAAGRKTKNGYQIQMFLPADSFADIHGPFRDTIYIDVAVKDVDGEGNRSSVFWAGNSDNWQYPHNFKPLELPVY